MAGDFTLFSPALIVTYLSRFFFFYRDNGLDYYHPKICIQQVTLPIEECMRVYGISRKRNLRCVPFDAS